MHPTESRCQWGAVKLIFLIEIHLHRLTELRRRIVITIWIQISLIHRRREIWWTERIDGDDNFLQSQFLKA